MLRPFPSYASTLLLDSERHHHKSGRRLFRHQKRYRHARIIAVSSSEDDVCNYIPAASIFLPDGPWTQISGGVVAAKGFKAAGIHAGLRAKGERPDLALVLCETDAISAGAFTTNVVAAAPVTYCKHVLHTSRKARAVLINAGQANAATGEAGFEDTLESAKSLAQLLHVRDTDVLIESTGVIGQRIKKESLLRSLPVLVKSLTSDIEGSDSASIAITTTDLVRKTTAVKIQIGGVDVRIGGMAKGSGMIHPNMATMLAVFTTDAGVASDVWRKMVRMAVDKSFNQITVDGDTSTNDCVIALASGLSGSPPISSSHSREAQQLQLSLVAVMQGLARAIASDGEGATCLVEVMVTGADTEADAAKIARTVASSSLTKAAVYGRDPNWGRIACAAGYAGVAFQPRNLHITLGDIPLMANGRPLPFNRDGAISYMRKAGNEHGTVQIHICVGNALGTSVAWGCDMSYDYVKINAEYTS